MQFCGYEKLERLGCGYAGVVPRGLDKEQAACNVREPSWHMPWNILKVQSGHVRLLVQEVNMTIWNDLE